MNNRLNYIDSLKGLAMLLVVMGHIILFCGLGNDNNVFLRSIVLINMPLFLFLNGLVVRPLPLDNSWTYLGRKFCQIMIPFISWGLLLTLFKHETYINFLLNYWKFGYWYLIVLFELFILYVIIAQVYSIISKNTSNTTLKAVILFILISFGYVLIRKGIVFLSGSIMDISSYFQILDYYPYFFIGVIIRQFKLCKYFKTYKNLITTILLTLAPPFLYFTSTNTEIFGILNIALRISLIFLLYIWFMTAYERNYSPDELPSKVKSLVETIGRHSLSIYMIQFFLFQMMNFHELYEYLYNSGNSLAIVVISLLLSVIMCYICIVIEKAISVSRIFNALLFGKIAY